MGYMGKLEITAGLIALLLIASGVSASEEEYYTWVDENGVVNFSERNPQGYNARHVTAGQRQFGYHYEDEEPEEPPADPQSSEQAVPPAGERPIDKELVEEEKRINQEIAATKRTNCNIGRLNLKQLQNYNRIRMKDDDGKVRVLTDEEKQARIAEAQKTINENCE